MDNQITEFTDNPNLLNVAVSRAVSKLRLVVSDNEYNENTNIGDLIRYIVYEKGEVSENLFYHFIREVLEHKNSRFRCYCSCSSM